MSQPFTTPLDIAREQLLSEATGLAPEKKSVEYQMRLAEC